MKGRILVSKSNKLQESHHQKWRASWLIAIRQIVAVQSIYWNVALMKQMWTKISLLRSWNSEQVSECCWVCIALDTVRIHWLNFSGHYCPTGLFCVYFFLIVPVIFFQGFFVCLFIYFSLPIKLIQSLWSAGYYHILMTDNPTRTQWL